MNEPQELVPQEFVNTLQMAIGALDLAPNHALRQDVDAVCRCLTNPNTRIAVFAPFNYGKSTLLNALLGERALPIDLIPTTGAAITVRYGDELQTRITLRDGQTIHQAGTDVLKQFAILDDQRRMREDVAAVEVFCPHPFLQTGVEFVDLPGTDDQETQDALVKNQLLTADVVIQVLDARKLMTLQEREHLRDWLLDRGIETVVFVVNFVNLLEPDDQRQVLHRLRFVAESFRATLPAGMSNLYRVDALPALRAKLKGDTAAAQTTGLSVFESAIQTIAHRQYEQSANLRMQRVPVVVRSLQQALQTKIEQLLTDVDSRRQKQTQRLEIQQKARSLLKQGFRASAAKLQEWLALPNVLDRYEEEAILALQQSNFSTWETDTLKAAWLTQVRDVVEWVYKACEFFECPRPADLWVAFPPVPAITPPNSSPMPATSSDSVTGVAVATGLGWVLGGPLGAAVLGGASYILNQTGKDSSSSSNASQPSVAPQQEELYRHAVRHYLVQFSASALAALDQYEKNVETIWTINLSECSNDSSHHHQLNLLRSTLERLNTVSEI